MSKRNSPRRDVELSKLRYEIGVYEHPESFVTCDGKEYLVGSDVTNRRREVYERDGRHCVVCGRYLSWEQMELDHIGKNYGQRRHDNIENLRALCASCHRTGPNAKHA